MPLEYTPKYITLSLVRCDKVSAKLRKHRPFQSGAVIDMPVRQAHVKTASLLLRLSFSINFCLSTHFRRVLQASPHAPRYEAQPP